MRYLIKLLIAVCLFVCGMAIQAQNTIPATGGNLNYKLYNTNGELLRSDKLDGIESTISMSLLMPSVYLLEVRANDQVIKIFKIIKN